MPIKNIQLKSNARRAILFVGALICIAAMIFFVKTSFGHAISIRAEQKEIADLSISLAPDDPQTHFTSAVLREKSFLAEDLETSVAEYETAAALSPNDYLLWLALGKARERNGDARGAEKALLRAADLAPNYVDVHWTLGNNLLRQGKSEQAYDEIRKSAIGSDVYVIPAIDTAWRIFGGDIQKIKQNIGNSPKLNAFLAIYLNKQERFDDAFEVWNGLSEEMKSETYKGQSAEVYNQFISARKYRYASLVKTALDAQDGTSMFGKFTNGGFEDNVKKDKIDFFDWQLGTSPQPLVGYDDKIRHDGNLSLVIIFNSPDGQDFRTISQTIAVEAGKSYTLQTFYKSELKSLGTLRWEVLNAFDSSAIASTAATAENTNWTTLDASFTAPENSQAVIINLVRVKCGSTNCPIIGKVWFDDFSLSEK
ncbi:MAG: carbohydrate binding domain-containing protein [Pyrinomonadaceae bacterium]